jgi:hypothetical protein
MASGFNGCKKPLRLCVFALKSPTSNAKTPRRYDAMASGFNGCKTPLRLCAFALKSPNIQRQDARTLWRKGCGFNGCKKPWRFRVVVGFFNWLPLMTSRRKAIKQVG